MSCVPSQGGLKSVWWMRFNANLILRLRRGCNPRTVIGWGQDWMFWMLHRGPRAVINRNSLPFCDVPRHWWVMHSLEDFFFFFAKPSRLNVSEVKFLMDSSSENERDQRIAGLRCYEQWELLILHFVQGAFRKKVWCFEIIIHYFNINLSLIRNWQMLFRLLLRFMICFSRVNLFTRLSLG